MAKLNLTPLSEDTFVLEFIFIPFGRQTKANYL
jgi:hypothetical protein